MADQDYVDQMDEEDGVGDVTPADDTLGFGHPAAVPPPPTKAASVGGKTWLGRPEGEEHAGVASKTSPRRIREAARRIALRKGHGALAFLEDKLKNGTEADKKWATEQILKYGIGQANSNLDDEGNATGAPGLFIIERDEDISGEAREP